MPPAEALSRSCTPCPAEGGIRLAERRAPNASLDLEFRRRSDGETYISRQFFKLPLQIFPPYYPDTDGTAFLYMLNPSSGMLEGDLFDISFRLGEGSAAVITTPSTNKIYRSHGGQSCQRVTAEVLPGAVLEYIPESNIPYAESRFCQQAEYNVHKGGTLFFWDIMSAGRIARGEVFRFTDYRADTAVRYEGRLILKDCAYVCPELAPPDNPALFGDHMIYTSAYLCADSIPKGLAEELRGMLGGLEGVRAGVSETDQNLLSVKLLFRSTLHVQEILYDVWNIVRKYALGKPAFRIRKY